MSTWAVIPCHRPYLTQLRACVESVRTQVDPLRILVIATCAKPIASREVDPGVRVLRYEGDWNISRWWNLGLDFAAVEERGRDHEVLVLNADATLERDAVSALRFSLRYNQLAVVAPDVHGVMPAGPTIVHRELRPLSKAESLAGCCFMVAGEKDLRCDPLIPGWYNEDDLDWQARRAGGVGLVPLHLVNHTDHGAGSQLGDVGLARFTEKWGSVPWI